MTPEQKKRVEEIHSSSLPMSALAEEDLRFLLSIIDAQESEMRAVVESIPNAVRVCEGGGEESIEASLAVSVAKLKSDLEAWKDKAIKAGVRNLTRRGVDTLQIVEAENERLKKALEVAKRDLRLLGEGASVAEIERIEKGQP